VLASLPYIPVISPFLEPTIRLWFSRTHDLCHTDQSNKYFLTTLTINGKRKRYLRGLSHDRKPVVTIGGKGLSESVSAEIEEALSFHELLKIKLPALPRQERDQLLATICSASNAEIVQTIGRVGVIYRAAEPPQIKFPD